MAKCLYCKEKIWSLGTKPKKFCSDAHRMAYKRTNEQQANKDSTGDIVLPAPGSTSDTQTHTIGACVKSKPERTERGNIRVSKPGDADYVPMCETTRAFVDNRPKRPSTAKRGKDIKCFEDLPPDVQVNIRRVSVSNEEFKRRTGIAIHYQHVFPNRYYAGNAV